MLNNNENLHLFNCSVNKIKSLADFEDCMQLQELYLRKNNIQDINDLVYLQVSLWFITDFNWLIRSFISNTTKIHECLILRGKYNLEILLAILWINFEPCKNVSCLIRLFLCIKILSVIKFHKILVTRKWLGVGVGFDSKNYFNFFNQNFYIKSWSNTIPWYCFHSWFEPANSFVDYYIFRVLT